ncbi:MAG: M16 family metallopeptidase [Pyrinomonadaceae bacterium]
MSLRIHSGAAFDVAGKSGEMAVLGDILFPDPTTREYFTDEMGGRLDVDTDLDAITVIMQGNADQFERIVEILRTALVTTQISPENVARIRDGRIKIVKDIAVSPGVLADRAIAARLFGEFPYGRPATGSPESLARVDRADLLLARERFLNANNATLTIIGGVTRNRAVRALRQLLGPWRKSEQIIPTTFRQPEAPDPRPLIINAPADQSAEVRLAVRGLGRSDRDFQAATLLAVVARQRWERLSPEISRRPVFVRHEAHVLPGIFVMGAGVDNLMVGQALKKAREVMLSLIASPISSAELDQAKAEVTTQLAKDLARPEGIARVWLDVDTFGLPSDQTTLWTSVTTADLQRVAARLFRDVPIASVVLGDSKQLQAALGPSVKVELMGELERPTSKSETKPTMTIPSKKPE